MARLSNEFRQERQELVQQGLRRCYICHEVKSLEDNFYNDSTGANGKFSYCKECSAQKQRDWYHKDDGLQGALDNGYKRAGTHGRRRRRVKADRLLKVWKKQGIDPMTCFYTGVELTREPGQPNTRNLDHVEPLAVKGTKGHVANNIVPCSASFNRYKQNKVAVYAYLTAPEQHQPVSVYIGLAPGMVGVDFYGNPNTPATVTWSPSEHKGEPEEMDIDTAIELWTSKYGDTAEDSTRNDALQAP